MAYYKDSYDLTGDCYRLFLEFWKIAPSPSKIAPGSGKIL